MMCLSQTDTSDAKAGAEEVRAVIRPRRGATKALAITGAVALAATGTAFAATRGHKGAARARTGVTAVEVARATPGTAVSALMLSGSVVATSSLPLSAGTSGRVSTVDVSVGQSVAPGQALMTVADPVLQAHLSEAEAAVATAEAKLAAAEAPPSASATAVASAGVVKARATLAAAESAYQQAQQAAASPPTTVSPTKPHSGGSGQGGSGQSAQAQVSKAAEAVAVANAGLVLAEAQAAKVEASPTSVSMQPLVAAVSEARAAEGVVRAEIAQGSLAAPFAGTVASLSVVVGAEVSPGTTVLTLDSTSLGLQAPVSQSSVSLVRVGERATASLLGASSSLPMTVSSVSPSESTSSLTFDVTLLPVSPAPAWLHPGEAATVSIVISSKAGAVLVPASAIVSINGIPQVFVVNTSASPHTPAGAGAEKAHKHNEHKKHAHKKHEGAAGAGAGTVSLVDVSPSVSDGSTTEVSGLSAGAEVVVSGQTYLASGDQVRVAGTVKVPASVTGSSVGGILTAPASAGAAAKNGRGGAGGTAAGVSGAGASGGGAGAAG